VNGIEPRVAIADEVVLPPDSAESVDRSASSVAYLLVTISSANWM